MAKWALWRVALLLVLLGASGAHIDDADDAQVMQLIDEAGGDATLDSTFASDNGMALDEGAAFDDFTRLHKKRYASHGEYKKRFGIWQENLRFVQSWNAADNSFQVGMNEFADLSEEEFAKNFLNKGMHNEFQQSETFEGAEEEERQMRMRQREKSALLELGASSQARWGDFSSQQYDIRWHKNTGSQPEEQDWHKRGATTNVNNQAKCFACYAFSAAGAIEGAKFINTGKMVRLSSQQIVDCSRKEFNNHGCKGGTMVKSYKYIINNGLMKWSDYGYNTLLNSSPSCKTSNSKCKYNRDQVQQRIVGYVNIRKGDEEDLKNAVSLRPISVAIDAHHRAFKLYRSGVFSLASCTSHLTHGVLMVGYGTASGGKPFWKIKNSWGTTWGSNGYGHIIRGKNMCSIADWSNYPIIDKADGDKVSAVRSLSELGAPGMATAVQGMEAAIQGEVALP